MSQDNALTLPAWFVRVCTAASGVILACAVAASAWAWRADNKLTAIETRMESREQVDKANRDYILAELSEIKRRLDKLEDRRN
jgi:tellurite resistance protein